MSTEVGQGQQLLKLLFKTNVNILLVGDPRQVTYLTHHEPKFKKYCHGQIVEFIKVECKKEFPLENIDDTTFKYSHRNNLAICQFSSKLYRKEYPESKPCTCVSCREKDYPHQGVYLVEKNNLEPYLSKYNPVQLRWDNQVKVYEGYSAYNFGLSKGLKFAHVLIYPTKLFIDWLKNDQIELKPSTRAKFYVAITRAKYSVGVVYDENDSIEGMEYWNR